MKTQGPQEGMILVSCLLILSLMSMMLLDQLQAILLAHRRDAFFIRAQTEYFQSLNLLKGLSKVKHEINCEPVSNLMYYCKSSTQNIWRTESLGNGYFRGTVIRFRSKNRYWMGQRYWKQNGNQIQNLGWIEKHENSTTALTP